MLAAPETGDFCCDWLMGCLATRDFPGQLVRRSEEFRRLSGDSSSYLFVLRGHFKDQLIGIFTFLGILDIHAANQPLVS